MDTPDKPPVTPLPYDPATYCRDESVGYLIAAVRGRIVASLDAALEPLGITGPQWGALMAIHHGADTAAETCRQIGCDTGSMTRMLDRLEEKGLLRRERSAADRRVVKLVLTEAGQQLPLSALPLVVGMLNEYLRGFSPEEVEQLKALLRKLLANAPAAPIASAPPSPPPAAPAA